LPGEISVITDIEDGKCDDMRLAVEVFSKDGEPAVSPYTREGMLAPAAIERSVSCGVGSRITTEREGGRKGDGARCREQREVRLASSNKHIYRNCPKRKLN
jgi:hypothetical protein